MARLTVTVKRLRWSRSSVLAFGTQVRGFKPGRIRRIFQGEKILIAPSFGREVKPSAHVAYLRHLKEPESVCVEVAAFGPNYRPFLAQVVPPSPTRVWWRQLAVQVGTTRDQGLYNGK